MAAQAGLSLTWSHTPKTVFLVTRLTCASDVVLMPEQRRGKICACNRCSLDSTPCKSMCRCSGRPSKVGGFLQVFLLFLFFIRREPTPTPSGVRPSEPVSVLQNHIFKLLWSKCQSVLTNTAQRSTNTFPLQRLK